MSAAPFPDEFDPRTHLESFNRYLAASAGPRGYETDVHTELLVMRKSR